MKVLIIEDEHLAVERLRLLLQEYDSNIEIVATLDAVAPAIEWFNTHPQPDLIFLDIELGDGMCFTIFSEASVKCPVIFTTAYDHYALDAFQLFSIDYLLKPVTLQSLASSIQKYREMISFHHSPQDITRLLEVLQSAGKNYKERFLVKSGTRMFFIEDANILYFFADDKTIFLVDAEGTRFVIDFTLDKLQEMLNPKYFFRLNRKILCRITSIKEVKTYFNNRLSVLLQAGKTKDEIIISRDRVAAFKLWAEA
ncbi:MAG: LytTR family DNA-binding domain-containing protein [Agriterribacter sp.]